MQSPSGRGPGAVILATSELAEPSFGPTPRIPAGTPVVAFLRGINLGRNKRIAMPDLVRLMEALGFGRVRTVLQSGNVLFEAPEGDETAIASRIEAAIQQRMGFDVRVLVRTMAELEWLVIRNPLPEATAEPSRFMLTLLSDVIEASRAAGIDPDLFAPDQFRFGHRAVYVWYRGGVLGSKLTYDLWERRLGVVATARNWNTVSRLVGLAGEHL